MNACRALPALLACFVSISAFAKSAYDRSVAPDSEVVRAVLAQPLNTEVEDLLLARETLSIAGDETTATALDAYLSRIALARLAGKTPAPPVARIGDLPGAGLPTPQDKADLAAVLSSTLRATLVRAGQRDLVARIENASPHTIRQYDVKLALPRPNGEVYVFSCDRIPYTDPPLAPGEGREKPCKVELNSGGIEDYLSALGAHPGAPLPVVPSSIEFHDLPVIVWSGRADWNARQDARGRAMSKLRELPCKMRGACGDDFGEWLSGHPQYAVVPAGAVGGLVMGALIGRFTRQRRRYALVVSIVAVAITVVAWFATGASGAGLAAIVLLFLAAALLGSFLVALWLAASLFARDRSRL